MSRYVTLPHAVYGVCSPSRCVCTQFCCVRQPNVSICEPRMKRTWIGVFSFFPVDLPQVPSAPLLFCCSIIVVKCSWGLGSCSWQSIDELLLWNLVSWQKRRKSNKKKPQRSRYKDEFPISYLLRAWRVEEKVRKRSRKEGDIKTKCPSLYLA